MFRKIRKSKLTKCIAVFCALNLMVELFNPMAAFALTGGPSQPEVQSFEPIGTSEMVNLFTGDFTYNIPLMDVGGYPINMAYNSGIGMDQEASWVGLGWNLNPGAITRQLRGLPDDFNGDLVLKRNNIKENVTYTASALGGLQVFGSNALTPGVSFSLGMSLNNYNGVGFMRSISPTISLGSSGATPLTAGLSIDSGPDGLALKPSVSLAARMGTECKKNSISVGLGVVYNSRGGLSALTIDVDGKSNTERVKKSGEVKHHSSKAKLFGSSISLGGATYTPYISMPMHSKSISVSGTVGWAFTGGHGNLGLAGSYAITKLKRNAVSLPAFGYNNSEFGQNRNRALLDFNREKDLPFSRRTPILPITNLTYDMYNISGQGIGGTFRSFRNDVGYVFDSRTTSESASDALGVEIGIGNAVHSGFNMNINDVNSQTGKWAFFNFAATDLRYRYEAIDGSTDYERAYYKQTGEKNVEADPNFVDNIHGDEPIRIDIASTGGFASQTTGKYASQNEMSGDLGPIAGITRKRQRRALSISKLNKEEAIDVGLKRSIHTSDATDHHTAEFTIAKPDGSRYVYADPLYNTHQKEVTFNASGHFLVDCTEGLVPYNTTDASINNTRGEDNFYASTELPAYVHSHMLSAVLAPDYVDITQDGPTEDDLGAYTLFNYVNPYAGEAATDYNWRTPYQEDMAYYDEGLKSMKGNHGDDRGSYIYGEKEIRYLSTIETKTHVAVFTTSERHDAHEVIDEHGGRGTNSFHKLDKIELFSKPDYDANYPSTAVPIKTVHFVYDYSLCDEVPNNDGVTTGLDANELSNDGGKLTLKKVYFTYQNSNKGMLNPYVFTYESGNSNPNYDIKGYDRWGNYKPNASACNASTLHNAEFPYVDQTQTQSSADNNAKAWCMNKITLPSGGEINIAYESDDYAFVQDREAYQMFTIAGISNDAPGITTPATSTDLYDSDEEPHLRIYVDIPSGLTQQQFYDQYLKDIIEKDDGFMYFNFLVDIKKNSSFDDYVKGYCKIQGGSSNYDVHHNGSEHYGWFDISSNGGDQPISKAAWQFGRLMIPKMVYNQTSTSGGILGTVKHLAWMMSGGQMLAQIKEMFEGPNDYFENKQYGAQINKEKCWVRLMNPTGKKYGGGVRVKQISMSDVWDDMSTESEGSYGQNYYYDVDGDGTGTSSGVAAYEPQLGGEENPLRQPDFYGGPAKLLAPDGAHYVETPYGESYFPAPIVGYARVTVQNIPITGVERHATGKTVHEFYTAKDFPTQARKTILEAIPQKSSPIGSALAFDVKDYMTASQGFVVELNDMHGKPKAQKVYAEGKTEELSSIVYHYKRSGDQLVNDVTVINDDGTLETAEIGVEYDMVADFRQHSTHSTSVGVQFNFESFFIPFPILVPPVWPSYSSKKQRFRSAVNTKVVARYGILEKTVATDLGSTIETKNLAYDTETGDVLVTETINDYNDPIYSFKYPAHWSYDRMGAASKNINVHINPSTGVAANSFDNEGGLLIPGDEVLIDDISGTVNHYRAWVWDDDESDDDVYLIHQDGTLIADSLNQFVKVIRSGRRNMLTASVGTITSLRNPLVGDGGNPYKNMAVEDAILYASNIVPWDELQVPLPNPLPTDSVYHPNDWDILNANMTEYSEEWKTNFAVSTLSNCFKNSGDVVNPYIVGIRGNWRPKRSSLYLGLREQRDNSPTDNNLDIRHDGLYSSFSPFWTPPSSVTSPATYKWDKDNTNWTWTTEVTDYSLNGFELENKDALGRYSSAVYGYANNLPIFVANNAQRQNVCFDGFEDYVFKDNTFQYLCGHDTYCNCFPDHFDFFDEAPNPVTNPIKTEAHTGNRSLLVGANTFLKNKAKLASVAPSAVGDASPYTLQDEDELKLFGPITYGYTGNKTYLLSYWVKEDITYANQEDYNDLVTYSSSIDVDVIVGGTTVTPINQRKSNIIDGWQKVEYEFTIAAGTTGDIEVKLIADDNNDTFFDDIRIQPIGSSMKSYVYDEVTLKLMAELDKNNFATFYEYDEEGALIRIKKETERGIVTIQESRNSKYKQ